MLLPYYDKRDEGPTAHNLTAEPGGYVITGAAATLKAIRLLTAAAGAYVITGTQATLTVVRGVQSIAFTAEPGAYALGGAAATLAVSRLFAAEVGAYALSGVAATFTADIANPVVPPPLGLVGFGVAGGKKPEWEDDELWMAEI